MRVFVATASTRFIIVAMLVCLTTSMLLPELFIASYNKLSIPKLILEMKAKLLSLKF
jgi:hypothetical protein